MTGTQNRVLQIVPQAPGTRDGVGDYALNLARALRRNHNIESTFLVANETDVRTIEGFDVLTPLDAADPVVTTSRAVVLHYVNYAFQRRGVPFTLRDFAQRLRRQIPGRWITMFHEMYASGAPWKSAFWLRPWQVRIARQLIRLSDVCFVSNDVIAREIRKHAPQSRVRLVPIMSNFGEPQLQSFERTATRWAVCGGNALIARSLNSLATISDQLPEWCRPNHVDVIGGTDDDAVTAAANRLCRAIASLAVDRHPQITAEHASRILQQCAFGWLDYFGSGKVWPGMIFKSGSFAACCANGAVPVLHHREDRLGVSGDAFPGPFFVTNAGSRVPANNGVSTAREQTYRWYHRHASADATARAYAAELQ